MLEKEFKFYLNHQEEFVKKYDGKTLVIVGEDVVGVYDDKISAYNKSVQNYPAGSFLIQLCTPGNSAYTQTFHSRVSFQDVK